MVSKKVLGVKVSDQVYDQFMKLPGGASHNLRIAIKNHINNMVNPVVNPVLRNYSHSQVVQRVDRLITINNALFVGSDNKQVSEDIDLASEIRGIRDKVELLKRSLEK